MSIEDLAYNADPSEVLAIKEELVALYNRELFEKQIYLEQTRKLEGEIVEILKRIEEQEEKHAELLMILLSKANVKVPAFIPKIPFSEVNAPLSQAIAYDISQEGISAKAYVAAIAKASKSLKELLIHIMGEEYAHIAILKKYFDDKAKE